MRRTTFHVVAAAALLAAGSTVLAQEIPPATPLPVPEPEQPEAPPEPRHWSWEIRGSGRLSFRADIGDGPGSVEIWRAAVGAGVAIPIAERARLSFDLDEEVSWYDFRGATGLAPATSDPFDTVAELRIVPRFYMQQTDRWGWFLAGIANFAGEFDADVGDSATFGGYAGVTYGFSERLSVSIGLGAKTRLEESVLALPVIAAEWKVNDRVTIASEGFGARVTMSISEQVSVSLWGRWELREFRLADDAPLPDGVVRDSRVPIGVSVQWRPAKWVELGASGGAVVWQRFRFDDSNGNEVAETNTDATGFLGVSARLMF